MRKINGGSREYEKTEDEFEQELNDIYEQVSICGMCYDVGRALRKIDPIAFNCALSDSYYENYQCIECDKLFDEREEAEECCAEYECEKCGEIYSDKYDVEACEEEHDETT